MNGKKSYLKYVAILLGAIFLIAAVFLVMAIWERRQVDVPDEERLWNVLTYEGQEYVRNSRVETFLVIGLDRYEDSMVSDSHGTGVQADFLMLLAFNNDTRQCTALQVNRDAMTKVNKLTIGGTGVAATYQAQIALAYNYVNDDNDKIRCRNTIDSVEALLTGVDVDHYFALTMDAVGAAADVVDGVEVTVLDDFTDIDDALIKGETVTLTGDRALTYVRTRYGMEDSTNSTRMERQQQFINALRQKAMDKIQAEDGFILELVDALDDYVVYDSSDQKMQKLLEKFNEYEFLGIRELEGESRMGEEFVEFYADEESILKTVVEMFYIPKPQD